MEFVTSYEDVHSKATDSKVKRKSSDALDCDDKVVKKTKLDNNDDEKIPWRSLLDRDVPYYENIDPPNQLDDPEVYAKWIMDQYSTDESESNLRDLIQI